MSDQKRWWKMWVSCLTDGDILALPVADRWRWAAFGTYVKEHGERGTIALLPHHPLLAIVFDVPPEAVFDVIRRLPNVHIEEGKSANGKITVTIRNWHKFQEDSTVSERVTRLRSKRRGEERRIRREKEETPSSPVSRDLFDRFWIAYPKKVGKHAARLAWDQLKPDVTLVERMLSALDRARQSEQWQREFPRYVPNPATWLNQRRWEDEPPLLTGEALAEAEVRAFRDKHGADLHGH